MPFVSDLRSALRSFRQSPGFVLVAVATLALGIGANTAMFSILSAVLLRPLPYPEAERLVFVRDIQPQLRDLPASYPEFLDWSGLHRIFEGIGAYWRPSANLTGEGEPERVDVCRLTPSLLPLLGIEPLFGRVLEPSDDRPGAERVGLLSHDLWQQRFGSDAGILGRSIRSRAPETFVSAMRDAIVAVDPEQPLSQIRTMEEVLDQNLAQRGFSTTLLAAFALLSVFLSGLGLYGVVTQTVGDRTREIGLRVTLGADARDILAMVAAGGARLVGIGIALGVAGALAVSRFLETLLFGVTPTDAAVLFAVALILAAVAALSLYLPARRAARLDPMAALRRP